MSFTSPRSVKLTSRNLLNSYLCNLADLESDPLLNNYPKSNRWTFDFKARRAGSNIHLNPTLSSCFINQVNVAKRQSTLITEHEAGEVLRSAIRLDQQGKLVLLLRVTKQDRPLHDRRLLPDV